MSISQFVDDSSTLSLEAHLERIALESGVLANLIETFKVALPNFVTRLRDVRTHLLADTKEQDTLKVKLSKKQKAAIEASRALSYPNFGERVISVPEGFAGNLLTYTVVLNHMVKEVNDNQDRVMHEYSTMLSSFLTNKDDKISLKDHTSFFTRVARQREDYVKRLSGFSSGNTGRSKARFKDVVERMIEVEQLCHALASLTASHQHANLQLLNTNVQNCVELLDMISNGVKDGKITNISPQATMNISKGAYEIAKYVEFIGVLYFDVTVFMHTMDGMMDALIETAKK